MSEDSSRAANEHRDVQRAASQADHPQASQTELPVSNTLPGLSSSWLGDPRLTGRGNGPVRVEMMQRMQQTYGNRTVRRILHLQRAIHSANTTDDITAPTVGAEEDSSTSNEHAQGDFAVQREPAQIPAGQPGAATPGQGLSTDIQARLGAGRPLDSSVRSGLEPALGQSFSNVRIHTDAGAADLSAGLNARAFTVGQDIAFGAGEYQPGTPAGDALIAHELAHVVQQGQRSTAAGGAMLGKIETEPQNDLEEDADNVAVGAVARLWGGAREGLAGISHDAMPQLRSGLRLSRQPEETNAEPTKSYLVPSDHNPLSLPGEQILFNNKFAHASPAEFQLVYTGVGGHFDTLDTGLANKTIPGLRSGNLPFFINSTWDGVSAVTVQLQVQRISDNSVALTYNWTFGKKVHIPTTITQAETEGDRPLPSVYTYTLGPNIGTDGYLHQTILETFGSNTCNITPSEIKPSYHSLHPGLTTVDAIARHFWPGGSGSNSTFTVKAGDKIRDQHGGGMPDKSVFEDALITMKEIHRDLPQTYEAQPGVVLGRYLIRRILKTDGSKHLNKIRQ